MKEQWEAEGNERERQLLPGFQEGARPGGNRGAYRIEPLETERPGLASGSSFSRQRLISNETTT
jgi:hypothetical protein